ncbi:aldo/keto reductase [Methanobacterium sp. MBAC-LM]|uniref:aldo/keto reductase n=1 Tax=Methanobacterium sp. MBAC-LM TaxID=3412034 RepID=UPI003C7508E1
MIYTDFKGIQLSKLGMGNMRLPTIGDDPGGEIDFERAQKIIDYAMDHGVNYYDTAYVYHNGKSESFLGKALEKYPRDSYYLATKFFIMANDDYEAVFEEQLSRLKTDYIDFYLIHGIFDSNWKQYIDCGCIEYFEEQKAKGHIKYLGFSSHASVENLTAFTEHHKWDFAQIQLNYYDWFHGSAMQEYEVLHSRNIPIISMEPLWGGRLATLSPEVNAMLKAEHPDWSIASWAFRWLGRLDGVQVILSGMSAIDQIKENVKLFQNDISLNDGDEELLKRACDAFRSSVVIPCTGCRYCCDDCPAQIDIPGIIGLYNRFKLNGSFALLDIGSFKVKPADCTGCNVCGEHCPQSIDVSAVMQELSEAIRALPTRS